MEAKLDATALRALSYGLFVLTTREGEKDNGCIINTCMQATDSPKRILIAVNKQNYSTELIERTGVFNVNILTEDAPFRVFTHFGFQSGRNVNKFEACQSENRTENGLLYLPKYTNAVLSGRVIDKMDAGTHMVYLADVTEALTLSDRPSVTYAYYFANIKPAPEQQKKTAKIVGWRCRICGYEYEGENIPADFLCPLCGHGVDDFEPIYG